MPGLDHQLVARLVQAGEDGLGDVEPESTAARDGRVRGVDFARITRELRLTSPAARIAGRRILGWAVHREAWIALQVAQFH